MNTDKAAYWIALGVLVLGLSSEYRHGNFVALHRVAERTGFLLCRIATRAEQTLAVARVLTSRGGFPVDSALVSASRVEMARAQAELLRGQAWDEAELLRDEIRGDEIRAQAEMRRTEVEQIRFRARSEFRLARAANHRVMVVCPKTGTRIAVIGAEENADFSPDVELEHTF